MITIKQTDNIIYTTASEKLDDEDYNKLIPVVKEAIEKSGKIRWYFEMQHFEGWTLSELWKDIKFDITHAKNMERVAMVGDKKWHEWLTKLMNPFTAGKTRYFDLADRDDAMAWIKS